MGAPFGNLFALGNNGGSPPKYKTNEELIKKISDYYDYIKPVVVYKDKLDKEDYLKEYKQIYVDGKPKGYTVIDKEEIKPSTTGLALYLGFQSRQSLYDYEKKDEFSYTIKRAIFVIENYYEIILTTGNSTGAIFALKNMGWSDRSEMDLNNNHKGEITITRVIKK